MNKTLVCIGRRLNKGELITMNLPLLNQVTSAGQARDLAIDWQRWASEQALSYGELAEYATYFRALAKRFKLTAEFKENGVI